MFGSLLEEFMIAKRLLPDIKIARFLFFFKGNYLTDSHIQLCCDYRICGIQLYRVYQISGGGKEIK